MVIKRLDELQNFEEDFTDEQLAEIERSVKEILKGKCGYKEKNKLIQYLEKQMNDEQFREYSTVPRKMKILRLYEFVHSLRLDYEEIKETFENLSQCQFF